MKKINEIEEKDLGHYIGQFYKINNGYYFDDTSLFEFFNEFIELIESDYILCDCELELGLDDDINFILSGGKTIQQQIKFEELYTRQLNEIMWENYIIKRLLDTSLIPNFNDYNNEKLNKLIEGLISKLNKLKEIQCRLVYKIKESYKNYFGLELFISKEVVMNTIFDEDDYIDFMNKKSRNTINKKLESSLNEYLNQNEHLKEISINDNYKSQNQEVDKGFNNNEYIELGFFIKNKFNWILNQNQLAYIVDLIRTEDKIIEINSTNDFLAKQISKIFLWKNKELNVKSFKKALKDAGDINIKLDFNEEKAKELVETLLNTNNIILYSKSKIK